MQPTLAENNYGPAAYTFSITIMKTMFFNCSFSSTCNSSIEYIFLEMLHACICTEQFFKVFLVVSLKKHLVVWLWFSLYIKYHFLKESSFGASVHLYSNQFHFFILLLRLILTILVAYKVDNITFENHKDNN